MVKVSKVTIAIAAALAALVGCGGGTGTPSDAAGASSEDARAGGGDAALVDIAREGAPVDTRQTDLSPADTSGADGSGPDAPTTDAPGTDAPAGDAPATSDRPTDGPLETAPDLAPADAAGPPDSAPVRALGISCSGGKDCASGFCVDGVCCSTRYCSECGACNVTGQSGTCQILRNAGGNGCSMCDGNGKCVSQTLQVSVQGVYFPPTQVGQTAAPAVIVVRNNTTRAQTIAISVRENAAGDFTILSDMCNGRTLQVGETCEISVTFSPRAKGDKIVWLSVGASGLDGRLAELSGLGI